MKKKIIVFLLFLILPFSINAAGIERFYMNAKVNIHGDIEIEEAFILNGEYNGFERILNYKNVNAKAFNERDDSSFGGSDIYNGSEIVLNEVKALHKDYVISSQGEMLPNLFESFKNKNMTAFEKVSSAQKGDNAKYTLLTTSEGINVKIFNPDHSKAFYLKYTVKGMGIKHLDFAEIGYNIFSNELNESIADFKMFITLPGDSNELRVWAHGPLTGESKIIGKNALLIEINDLYENTAIDTRFVYDRDLLETTKTTNVEALPKILKYEEEMAEMANKRREEAREQIEAEKRRNKLFGTISMIALLIWLPSLGYVIVFVYKKHDKEYETTIKTKYFRDIPSDYSPEIVGYLMREKITPDDLSATILYMINKNLIKYEKIEKKDYKLIDLTKGKEISEIETTVINLLFNNKSEVTLKELKKFGKTNYHKFLLNYELWQNKAISNGFKEKFFEKKDSVRGKICILAIIGILFSLYSLKFVVFIPLNIICAVAGAASFIYFISFKKRSIKGNEEYSKWNGLKNFINDFGNFKERELPQIELWEKYMVYAVSFGVASKLAKQMEIKMQNMNLNNDPSFGGYGYYYYHDLFIFNRIINSTVTQARSQAVSAKVAAESRNSSSGGFGGGFSGGGGSFGGGGGGGRF